MNAVGELAVAAMKKNKKLDQVSVEIPVLKDTISHAVQRQRKLLPVCLGWSGERGDETVYGFRSSKYETTYRVVKVKLRKTYTFALAEEAFS